MKKMMVSTLVAGFMAMSLALVGCGARPAATGSKTEGQAAQQQTSSGTKSDSSKSDSSKSDSGKSDSGKSDSSKSEATPTTTSTATPTTTSTAAPTSSASQISPDAAKQIALKDAGLAEGDVTNLKVELDNDDPTVHYDVDFKSGGKEYDYDIDVNTGAIISSKSEIDD